MRLRTALFAAILAILPLSRAMGQGAPSRADPVQSDVMIALQFQHIKLWFAGRLGNWPLASYELTQIDNALQRAALPGDPRRGFVDLQRPRARRTPERRAEGVLSRQRGLAAVGIAVRVASRSVLHQ